MPPAVEPISPPPVTFFSHLNLLLLLLSLASASYISPFFAQSFAFLSFFDSFHQFIHRFNCSGLMLHLLVTLLAAFLLRCWQAPAGSRDIPGLNSNPDPGMLENKIPGFFGISFKQSWYENFRLIPSRKIPGFHQLLLLTFY